MTQKITYDQCLDAMYVLRRFGIKLGLDIIGDILKALGNPQDQLRFIHIAGTNGKGSIAASLSSILGQAGLRVGLFTSPHLVRFNERIRINGREIENDHMVDAYLAVNRANKGSREATFFEITMAMAMFEFARQKVDIAVIETGMGGRMDATNIIQPMVSIISNISIEHRQHLGNTIAAIATEKAGIIKTGAPVVTGVRKKSAIAVIEKAAARKSTPCYRLGRAFRIRRFKNDRFNYYGLTHTWRDITTSLVGDHQPENAALAMVTCELLNAKGFSITEDHVRKGLKKVHWPARLEVVSTDPLIILDGAHNLAAARKLATYLSTRLADRKITLVTGILADKPYDAMMAILAPLADRVIVTRASSTERALAPEILAQAVRAYAPDTVIQPDVATAIQYAMDTGGKEDAIVVAGSLYVAGDAIAYLNNERPPDPGDSA
ncbi:MAG: bifunctional folylpolyglutamate synthase/dihydrofolate synthase [Deltaproteobacteria bacterium]|nr:MAG: bifunctional folylpolyglutamate synthase/dihydrofolate synthase [Deltaproteobacteria bacterium]